MSALWKSQLNEGLHAPLHAMNRSITFDFRLWPYDIQGSKAHVEMLEKSELISENLSKRLLKGLEELETDILCGKTTPQLQDEDVHGFVERELIERVGPEGSNVHIARSRNEQILLDVTLYLRDLTHRVVQGLDHAIDAMALKEQEAGETFMPSYTHLRRAQPMFVKQYWQAHKLLWEKAKQGFIELGKSLSQECPMGAGASNGTTLATQPQWEAERLGFARSSENSLATLSSRQHLLTFCGSSVHWLLDVSRLMEDLINWSSSEFAFVSLSPRVTTGSSMMPQKRNPDICELLRAQASVAMGHYVSLMMLLKGLPMGYMKDLQEDKSQLFAVADLMECALEALPLLLQGVTLNVVAMQNAAQDPLLLATDVMEWLVTKGIPLREAHHKVANSIHESLLNKVPFPDCVIKLWPDFPQEKFSPFASCVTRLRAK